MSTVGPDRNDESISQHFAAETLSIDPPDPLLPKYDKFWNPTDRDLERCKFWLIEECAVTRYGDAQIAANQIR